MFPRVAPADELTGLDMPEMGTPGYTTVDGRFGIEGPDGQWKVMFWGKNIFDKYYWTNVISSADSAARFSGRPATYGVTLSFKTK